MKTTITPSTPSVTATTSADATSSSSVDQIATQLLRREAPLDVALRAYAAFHGLRLSDVAMIAGYRPGAVSSMLHNPARLPGVERAVRQLIGYETAG